MTVRKRRIVLIIAAAATAFGAFYGWWRFHAPFFFVHGKGNIGAIGRGAYIVNDAKRNAVEWFENKRPAWTGAERRTSETIVIDESGIRPLGWSDLRSGILVVRFTPEKIQVYDLRDFSGGYYLRGPP